MEGGQGGEMGGGTREQCGSNKNCIGSLQNLTTGGDEGGGMGGRRGEVAHGGRARGDKGGGHQRAVWEQQKVHWFPLLGKNLTTGLIWLVTRVGGWGEAWGGGPWRAGKGGRWRGGTREQCGSNWFPLFELP